MSLLQTFLSGQCYTVERRKDVTSLWSASLDFVPEAPVWGRAKRRSGTTCNLVSMHIDDVAVTSQGLLREKWSLRQMETSDAHGNLFYSKGDRFHMCFTKWYVRSELVKKRQGVDVGH